MSRGRRSGVIPGLAQRERQVLDLLYQISPATAVEIQQSMDVELSNATIRTLLRNLEEKGHVSHVNDDSGRRHLYSPTVSKKKAASKAFDRIVRTFFAGSTPNAMANLIDEHIAEVDVEELDRLTQLIQMHRQKRKD